MQTKEQKNNILAEDLLKNKDRPLYQHRVETGGLPVIGEGNLDSQIIFIGEAPGKKEALTGKPFCGSSGKVLDKALAHILLDRKDIYITNIVKERPPENRDPTPEEIEAYGPYLDTQIDIIQPKVLAPLGRFSTEYIMKKFGLEHEIQTISHIHGKLFEATASFGKIQIMPLFHPAATIYNQHLREDFLHDFTILKKIYDDVRTN